MLAVCLFLVQILTPLAYVAAHVEDTQSIGLFDTYRTSTALAVLRIPGHVTYIVSSGKFFFFATTAGGIKLLRVYALTRLGRAEAERMIYPSMVTGGSEYDRFLATTGARSAWLFAMVFALTAVVIVALLLLSGMSLETGLIFTVAALSNTGPLVSVAGDLPLYWVLVNDPSRAVLALAMILGRLEILVFLALILGRLQRN